MQCLKHWFLSRSWHNKPWKPNWRERLSTVDLIDPTSLDQLLFAKEAALMRRSTVLSLRPLQLGFTAINKNNLKKLLIVSEEVGQCTNWQLTLSTITHNLEIISKMPHSIFTVSIVSLITKKISIMKISIKSFITISLVKLSIKQSAYSQSL